MKMTGEKVICNGVVLVGLQAITAMLLPWAWVPQPRKLLWPALLIKRPDSGTSEFQVEISSWKIPRHFFFKNSMSIWNYVDIQCCRVPGQFYIFCNMGASWKEKILSFNLVAAIKKCIICAGCVQTFWGHESDINSVFFHPSGTGFVSCSEDKTVSYSSVKSRTSGAISTANYMEVSSACVRNIAN